MRTCIRMAISFCVLGILFSTIVDADTINVPADYQTIQACIEAAADGEAIPFLTRYKASGGTLYVLNTHTYSQADFDAVGEVLLSPRALGLLEIPQEWAEVLRESFLSPLDLELKAPTRVCLQPLGESGWFLHNYNLEDVTVELVFQASEDFQIVDGFTGRQLDHDGNSFRISIPPRSRAWIERRG